MGVSCSARIARSIRRTQSDSVLPSRELTFLTSTRSLAPVIEKNPAFPLRGASLFHLNRFSGNMICLTLYGIAAILFERGVGFLEKG